MTTKVLEVIQEAIEATRIQMTDEEATFLWPKVKEFHRENGREPNLNAVDPIERRLADAIVYLKALRRKQGV